MFLNWKYAGELDPILGISLVLIHFVVPRDFQLWKGKQRTPTMALFNKDGSKRKFQDSFVKCLTLRHWKSGVGSVLALPRAVE